MNYPMLLVFLGAIVVQVLGATVNTTAKCNHRYFQHYVARGCQPVYETNDSQCPVRFNCPESTPETSGCKFQGKVIPIGEDIPVDNPCQMCSCRSGWNGEPPEIVCAGIECPSAFGIPLEEGCYEAYEKDKCCSTNKVCESPTVSLASQPTCHHNGESFNLGQHVHSVSDPCLVCVCTEGWTGVPETDPGCRRLSCVMEKDARMRREGCVPIYHEATCCPIEYECGENIQNTTNPLATAAEIESGDSCHFKGSHYRVGQKVDIAHPTNCVTCECTTPPELTCVHRQCTWPQDNSCVPHFEPGNCCPAFDCGEKE